MSEPLPILRGLTNKKEKILKLLSAGNNSTKDIARIVGTTESYVWKEKSKLKASGLLIRRDAEVISKTSQLNVCTNSSLLNVPQLDQEGLMKLYSQFLVGKKPPEVIAEYGFHPELVESEYQRFVRLAEYDIDSLQKKFFLEFRQDLLTTSNCTINSLLEKYRKDGKLTIDEFIQLIKSLQNEKYRLGKISAIDDLVSGNAPDGWVPALCLNCNKPIPGCMVDATKRSTITKTDVPIPWTHSYFGMSCAQL